MPDITSETNQTPNLPPPSGDPNQAEKYINQLIQLIESDKLDVSKTDLGKFDPSSLQDHYRLELKEYQVEVSHSKHPNTGKDSYIILFTNIKHVASGAGEKIILAYMYLNDHQFIGFKKAFNQQLERKRKIEEEKRLKEALRPVEKALAAIESESRDMEHTTQLVAQS